MARPLGKDAESVRGSTPHPMNPGLTAADEEIIKRVEKVAQDKGWKMSEVALTWLRSKGAIPIAGFNSIRRVEDADGLRGKSLTEEECKFLEEPYVPRPILGHW